MNWVGGIISGIGLLLALSVVWLDRIAASRPFEIRPAPLGHH